MANPPESCPIAFPRRDYHSNRTNPQQGSSPAIASKIQRYAASRATISPFTLTVVWVANMRDCQRNRPKPSAIGRSRHSRAGRPLHNPWTGCNKSPFPLRVKVKDGGGWVNSVAGFGPSYISESGLRRNDGSYPDVSAAGNPRSGLLTSQHSTKGPPFHPHTCPPTGRGQFPPAERRLHNLRQTGESRSPASMHKPG